MLRDTLAKLLELPATERVDIAMALWDSRRLAEHIADPASAIPWDEVRRKLLRGA